MDKRKFSLDSDNDSEVETIERTNFQSVCLSILIRLAISVVFLLILSAALVWSFSHGETGVYNGEIEKRNAEDNFTVFITQFAQNGRMTETFRGPDGSNVQSTYHKSHSFWYQNDKLEELVQKYDAYLMIYARKDYTFFANTTKDGEITSCIVDRSINYRKYIETIGLTKMIRPHGESVEMKKSKYVYVYQGEPSVVQLPFQNSEAFLVLAYADADTGALLGYDTYFTATPTSNLFKREYWYGEMLPAEPRDQSEFEIPPICADQLD
ncbi:hypothetical protein PFISCL1PPCAC_4136 [Pristionchus fissidentatus]|uniref:Uncharacterized protein n=1 Tax=Pristionchus fissidentatus TaxID=1538716 RepID=A0AAV5V2Q1_9BILA|nr:hypothetical protein PFISCL1PPCAC_4136 [Pristionchus fissidentatus]